MGAGFARRGKEEPPNRSSAPLIGQESPDPGGPVPGAPDSPCRTDSTCRPATHERKPGLSPRSSWQADARRRKIDIPNTGSCPPPHQLRLEFSSAVADSLGSRCGLRDAALPRRWPCPGHARTGQCVFRRVGVETSDESCIFAEVRCGCSSVVERHVANVNVVGSSPITRF